MNMILDSHIHSVFSDGELDLEEITAAGRYRGCHVGIADHAGTMYALNNEAEILKYLSCLDDYPVYKSMEININENFPLPGAVKKKLDYIIGGVHFEGEKLLGLESFSTAEPGAFIEKVTELILSAIRGNRINILSHPTCLPNSLLERTEELFNDERSSMIISSAIKHNVFLEINSLFRAPHKKFIQAAVEMGASFSLGSDGHGAENVCDLGYSLRMVEEFSIPEEKIFSLSSRN